MNWLLSFLTNLSNFVLEALETGVGGLLACFVAKQVFQKSFDAWVSKRIEEVKGVVAKKVYVSKIKFDTEYQLYQELCSVFYDVAEMISVLVPYSLDERHFANFLQLQSEMQNKYSRAVSAITCARSKLNRNVAFMQKEFLNAFNEILSMGESQLFVFRQKLQEEQESKRDNYVTWPTFTQDEYRRTREIYSKLNDVNNKIRKHLETLDILK